MSRKTVILATGNYGKVKELQKMLGLDFNVLSQSEVGFDVDVEETGDTLLKNASLKANALRRFLKDSIDYKNAFIISDDSGLFVDSLSNHVSVTRKKILGVRTARLSKDVLGREITKEERDSLNNEILLRIMTGMPNRKASFRTCLCLLAVSDGKINIFNGEMPLEVADSVRENGNGFAYDFCVKSTECNGRFVCDLTDDEKNAISHRGRAVKKLSNFLLNNNK